MVQIENKNFMSSSLLITAFTQGTAVTIYTETDAVQWSGTVTVSKTMNLLSTKCYRIVSLSPIMVAIFAKSYDGELTMNSDPFLTILRPTTQYHNKFGFATPPSPFVNYINVVVPSNSTADLILDGSSVSPLWTTIGSSGFSGAKLSVSAGFHVVESVTAFTGWAYGFDYMVSYSYPLSKLYTDPGTVTVSCKATWEHSGKTI